MGEHMKKYFAIVPAALAAMFIAGAAQAAEQDYTGEFCTLNSNQINNGFYCTQEATTREVSRVIGNGQRCQDATVTETTYRTYNQNNQLMSDRTVVTEPAQSDWSSSYPIGNGCNNPLL
jgi:hypothetical protein